MKRPEKGLKNRTFGLAYSRASAGSGSRSCPADNRRAVFSQRHYNQGREVSTVRAATLRRRDQHERQRFQALLARYCGAAHGAPNILLIMTDDQGYGVSSAFGGIPTPAQEEACMSEEFLRV
jgi:hypothetical protein